MTRTSANLNDILDACLARLEAGSPVAEIVAEYSADSPEMANELRALLEITQVALPDKDSLRVPLAAQRSSRQRFLARAEQLQQQQGAARWLGLLRFLQHNLGSIAFSMAAVLLLLVALGSVGALPGDGLYPVKIAAEQAGISLSASGAAREERETVYDARRAEEVEVLIQRKRTGAVSFGGFLVLKDRRWQTAGIPLLLSPEQEKQAQALSGAFVEIKGVLGNQGSVRPESLQPRLEALQGTITSIDSRGWKVGSQVVRVTADTRLSGMPRVGSQVTVQAARLVDGAQMLAISAAVTGTVETAAPTATATETSASTLTATQSATVLPTSTPEPTETEKPANHAKPIVVQTDTPESHDSSGSGSSPTRKSTGEPGDSHSTPKPGED